MTWLIASLAAAAVVWPSSCAGEESKHMNCKCSVKGDFHVPPDVSRIPANAFANCHDLTSVSGMDGVVSVGTGAFKGCTRLATFAWPSGTSIIPNKAFFHCHNLISITGLQGVTQVGSQAFMFDSSLPHVYLPPGCKTDADQRTRDRGCLRLLS
jgi:hypothetical protein